MTVRVLHVPRIRAFCLLGVLVTAVPTAIPRAAYAEEMQTITVVAQGGHLQPERVTVPAGKRFKLMLKNEGRGPVELENLDLRVEKVLAPGAASFVIVPPLKPGLYPFVDEFHPESGHVDIIAQ